ncbi:class I SAM-dependent methyltransferase [Tepidibacter aestuarii]|uniref:class I SAM-dependent methyltransferase n=1 Tax=Tepidibacter aestuarii TaxID=2925782 RepID=UPI0020BD829B|nr:class I SAM-dependent methyltransferase [Tepidibacter aestuarii]CAH2212230.1 Methyltransferase [Tepidibacter aestuarii]
MHKFQAKNRKKLDNEWRRNIMPPKETLEKLGLTKNDIVADIGCGIGYFTIPASEISDTVYAMDISNEMLEDVKEKSSELNIDNVQIVKTDEYDLKIENESVSFSILVNVLHEIEDKKRLLKEIIRISKKGSKIAIIEWDKKVTEMGPPVDHRLSKEEIENLFGYLKLEVKKELEFEDCFYGIVGIV